jgi:hypothetical protein
VPARERRAWALWFDLIWIQIQLNSNIIQIVSNFDPSRKDLPELKKIEINMVVKLFKKGTTFSIVTSSDSKWISNKNSDNFLGLKFNRISYNLFLRLQN